MNENMNETILIILCAAFFGIACILCFLLMGCQKALNSSLESREELLNGWRGTIKLNGEVMAFSSELLEENQALFKALKGDPGDLIDLMNASDAIRQAEEINQSEL